jgi:hypothetical protein
VELTKEKAINIAEKTTISQFAALVRSKHAFITKTYLAAHAILKVDFQNVIFMNV